MSRVTIKVIAEKAGVSIGTVDRALNDRGRISQKTKRSITQIARELGYRPNRLASALRKRRHVRIAVIMPKLPHYFMDELRFGADSISKELADFDVELDYIFSDTLSPEEQKPLLENLDLSIYDAVAINAGSDILVPYIDRIVEAGLPVATFNSDVPNSKRLFYVGENSYAGGRVAGELMGKLLGGKGTVAIFAGFSTINSHNERANGFKDYLDEHYPRIEVIDVLEYHDKEEEAFAAVKQLLRSKRKVDGIFCVSAVGTVGVGSYLRQNIQPESICLVGYDVNSKSAELVWAGYCAVLMYQEPRKQSRRALRLLFDMISDKWEPKKEYYYTKTKIVLGENLVDYAGDFLDDARRS